MSVSVISPIIHFRLMIAEQLGADRHKIMEKAGISPKELADPENRISLKMERVVWQGIVEATGREDIGLICGQNLPIRVASVIGYVMMNAPSISVAIQKMCTYQKLVGNSMGMDYDIEGKNYRIKVVLWTDWVEELRYTMDIIMASILSWTENNTIQRIRPEEVGFSYSQPSNYQDYEKLFAPAPVYWGVKDSYLLYQTEQMNAPVISANRTLFSQFDQMAKTTFQQFRNDQPFSSEVKHHILEALKGEVPSLEQIAAQMTIGIRSLQAKLKQEGTSFQILLNNVRKELAQQHLKQQQASKSEIAYLLGFSEVSVFSRNFKKWTGMTPTQYQLGL